MEIDFSKWEYEFQQRNTQPILMADTWLRALNYTFKEEIDLSVADCMDYIFTADGKGWVKKDQKRHILSLMREACAHEKYFIYIRERLEKRVLDLQEVVARILHTYERANAQELKQLWQDYTIALEHIVPWFWIPWYITEENIIVDKARLLLEPYRPDIEEITDFNNALMILITSEKKTKFQKEQLEFIQLLNLDTRGVDINKIIQAKVDYLKNFAFLKAFVVPPCSSTSMEELDQQIKEARNRNHFEDFSVQEKRLRKEVEIKKQLLEIISKDTELIQFIAWAQEFGYLLTASVEDIYELISHTYLFHQKIAQVLKLSYIDLSALTSDEISRSLGGEIDAQELNLGVRQQGYFFLQENGERQEAFGLKALELSTVINEKVNLIDKKNIKEIQGQPAMPGIIKGKVRLMLTAHDIDLLVPGEILVASMTSPDYVPAMRQAAGIITSEGGLLCHAAIISRELGKPCIVGTKIATQVLSTGDEIEMDGTTGKIALIK